MSSEGSVLIEIDGVSQIVRHLAWHTHPRATGPSDYDREFLKVLRQQSSLIYEMFADGQGTRFMPSEKEST